MQRNPFRFEKLEVWQLARRFNRRIYTVVGKFPDHERHALSSQLRRASVSVVSNIAEGAGAIPTPISPIFWKSPMAR